MEKENDVHTHTHARTYTHTFWDFRSTAVEHLTCSPNKRFPLPVSLLVLTNLLVLRSEVLGVCSGRNYGGR